MTVTRKTIHEAYGSLIHAEALLDILIRSDVDLVAGEVAAVCNVLLILLSKGANVLDALNCGYGIEPEKRKGKTSRALPRPPCTIEEEKTP
jgi:hypothetical protein